MYPNQPDPQQPPQPEPHPGFPPQPQGYPNQVPSPNQWQAPQPQQPFQQPTYPSAPQPQPQPTFQNQQPQPAYHQNMPQQPAAPHPYGNPYQQPYQPPTPPKNKKKLITIIVAAVVVVGVAAFLLFGGGKSIINKIAGVELEKYTNTTFGFSMDVPKDWDTEEKNEEYLKEVSFDEPVGDVKDQDTANTHYAWLRVDYSTTDKDYLEKDEQEYFDAMKKGLQQAIAAQEEESDSSTGYAKEIATVESEEMVTVNGLKAYKVKLKITNYDGDKDSIGYEYGMVVYVDSRNQYQISMSAHASEAVNSKADDILTSFAVQ